MVFNESNKINFDYFSSKRNHILRSDYHQIIYYIIVYFVIEYILQENTIQDRKREVQEIY